MVGRSKIAVLASVLALAGAGVFASVAQAASVTITLASFQFSPSPVHLTRGDYVTWVNKDPVPAQVMPAAGGFANSPVLQPGQHYTARITGSGMINYYDAFNNFIRGTLIVANAPLPTATPKPTARADRCSDAQADRQTQFEADGESDSSPGRIGRIDRIGLPWFGDRLGLG